MKYYFLFLNCILVVWFSCSQPEPKSKQDATMTEKAAIPNCNENYDSVLLRISNEFVPTSIDLNGSLSPTASSFVLKLDTLCLRKQSRYEDFIVIVLAKLYSYHLKCCNQSYDLLSMKNGAAGIIINEFKKIAGYQNRKHLEFLSSSKIVGYIEAHSYLQNQFEIQSLLREIKKEEMRIVQ